MTTLDLLDRIPVERITAEARQVHFRRTALTLLAGLFWLIGWSVAKVFGALWFAGAWAATAIRIGWADARQPAPPAPSRR
jgi:hypothetical protein